MTDFVVGTVHVPVDDPAATAPAKPTPWDLDTGGAAGPAWNADAPSPFPPPPRPPGYGDDSGGGVQTVSVGAIRRYADNIESFLPLIAGMIGELDAILAAPFGAGNCGAGNNLKLKIVGNGSQDDSSALASSIRQVYVQTETVLRELVSRCRAAAQLFADTDRQTVELSDELRRQMDATKSRIDNLPLGTG